MLLEKLQKKKASNKVTGDIFISLLFWFSLSKKKLFSVGVLFASI